MRIAAVLAVVIGLMPGTLLHAENETVARARALFEATDFARAITLLESSHHDSAHQNAGSLELLGRCYFLEGDYKRATETLEHAAALRPNDSLLLTWLARAYGRRAETSFAFSALHFANRSRETFERAVELDPANKEALGDLFDFYIEAPAIAGGGTDKALGLLLRIAHADPVGYELAEAQLAERDKQFDKSEARLRRAIEIAPNKPGLYIDLAKFLARRGRHDESEAAFLRARAVAPTSPRIDFERAETYLRHHRNREEARALLRKYVASKDLTPNDPPRAEALRLLKKAEGG
jgi:tetratricopeptide (TPR) repeat protein